MYTSIPIHKYIYISLHTQYKHSLITCHMRFQQATKNKIMQFLLSRTRSKHCEARRSHDFLIVNNGWTRLLQTSYVAGLHHSYSPSQTIESWCHIYLYTVYSSHTRLAYSGSSLCWRLLILGTLAMYLGSAGHCHCLSRVVASLALRIVASSSTVRVFHDCNCLDIRFFFCLAWVLWLRNSLAHTWL